MTDILDDGSETQSKGLVKSVMPDEGWAGESIG
jgi:hypothetical protein